MYKYTDLNIITEPQMYKYTDLNGKVCSLKNSFF